VALLQILQMLYGELGNVTVYLLVVVCAKEH